MTHTQNNITLPALIVQKESQQHLNLKTSPTDPHKNPNTLAGKCPPSEFVTSIEKLTNAPTRRNHTRACQDIKLPSSEKQLKLDFFMHKKAG